MLLSFPLDPLGVGNQTVLLVGVRDQLSPEHVNLAAVVFVLGFGLVEFLAFVDDLLLLVVVLDVLFFGLKCCRFLLLV